MPLIRRIQNPERIKAYLNDPHKKNLFKVIKELFILGLEKREIPYYYFKHIYKNEVTNIKDYLGTKERAKIHVDKEIQRYELSSILQNKLSFALFCEKYNLKSPYALGYNFSSHFVSNIETIKSPTKEDVSEYFEKIMIKEGTDVLFCRPIALLKGTGCFKINKASILTVVEEQFSNLINGSYVFTPIVVQHPKINAIHSNSVNTIRLLTFICDDGVTRLISAAMRFGIGESVVDNSGFGGFFVGINRDNGTLKEAGWNKEIFGRKRITHHPSSGFELKGFQVPFYDEAVKLVIDFTEFLPNRLIGWDVAITPDGPTVIEANHDPSLFLSDVANEGILKNPYFRGLVERVNKS